jgi:hypothetical protein
MADTLLALIAAHLLADFPFQTDWLLRHKRNPAVLLLHMLIVAGTAAFILGAAPWPLLAILAGTHMFMDAIKVYVLKDTLRGLLIDQFVHLIVIAGLVILYPEAFAGGLWTKLPPGWLPNYQAALCLVAGTILSLHTGAIIIKKATQPFLDQIGSGIEGLRNGGAYIGCLERALVMLLVLTGQPAGVGFLIAAKSILRFGDVKETHQRQMTEYVIIGTFLSFGWGLLTATLTQLALKHWAP